MGCRSSKDVAQSTSPIGGGRSLPACHHVVALTSSTLGSLRLDPAVTAEEIVKSSNDLLLSPPPELAADAKLLSETTPPHEPETINAWELMEGLEDALPPHAEPEKDRIFSNPGEISGFNGIVKARVHAFQEKIDARKAKKPPPCGEGKVVFYFTSLRGVRKTYEDCAAVKIILQSYNIRVDERDVSMHAGFRSELNDMLGPGFWLPRVFADGKYVGGAEEVRQMHDAGELGKVFDGCEMATARKGGNVGACEGCGDVRFVPCDRCSGSCKVFLEMPEGEEDFAGFRRCPECNENGLVRCRACC